jgi:hypothetical protein
MNWQGLVDLADQTKGSFAMNPSFFFRGQARADWHLVPSFVRVAEANKLNTEQALLLEAALRKEFLTGAHLHLPPAVLPQNPADQIGLWICMQHYGAPTRLLDWTESLYVATYFAVVSELDYDGAVWVIHPRSIRTAFNIDEQWPTSDEDLKEFTREDAPSILYTIRGAQQTDRMNAQQTVLTVSPQILARHDPLLEKVHQTEEGPQGTKYRYIKAIIPKELKLEFLAACVTRISQHVRCSLG